VVRRSVKPAAKANPQDFVKLFQQAFEHHQAGRMTEAGALYEQVLAVNPRHADSLHLSGMVAYAKGDFEKAVKLIEKAIKIEPKADLFLGNLGNVLRAKGEYEAALQRYTQAIAINAKNPLLYCNRGNVYVDQNRLDDAIAAYTQAIALRPDFYEAMFNQALALRSLGRLEEAIQQLRNAIACHPNPSEAHYTLGQMLLLHGELEAGWPEYDWRWKLDEYAWLRNIHGEFKQPLWSGEPITGKTILVYAEQGMGDAVQFVRYVPELVKQGAAVVFAVHPRLRRLMGTMPGVTIVALDCVPLPPFDIHAPLLSLPRLLGVKQVSDIRAHVPYLSAEAERVAHWKARLAAFKGFKIGIAWQGNPGAKIDKGRSPPLAAMAPLASVPGIHLISLQQRDGLDQLDALPPGMKVERLGEGVDADGAFVDTAAIMANLDLLIVSDSAIAHVAGALGLPVWVPLKEIPDWRFLLGREDCPWYPSMRLFRQQREGEWGSVFEAMADQLALLTGNANVMKKEKPVPAKSAGQLPLVPVSWGEIIDKITILEIKTEQIADAAKLVNIRRELHELVAIREQHFPAYAKLAELAAKLKKINEALWWVEDDIRICEREQNFGKKFIELARAVYVTNDQRSVVKREINDLLGSELIEEKSYAKYVDDQAAASQQLLENAKQLVAPATKPAAPAPGGIPLSPYVKGVLTESGQGRFLSDIEDQFIGRSLRETGEYGGQEIVLVEKYLKRSDHTLVVGSHIGTIVVALARRCERVTAIEANPQTYKLLQCNLLINECSNVDAYNFAASDKDQRIRFVLSRHNSGGSKRYPVIEHPNYFYDNPQVIEVDGFNLDRKFAEREFDFVFMDIEGSEYFALQGMQRILRKVRVLFVEFLPHHLRNVAAVEPEEFARPLAEHFDFLYIPGMNAHVSKENFGLMLRRMYDMNYAQEQIVFFKREAANTMTAAGQK
jgi:FkbM family methyltransferase